PGKDLSGQTLPGRQLPVVAKSAQARADLLGKGILLGPSSEPDLSDDRLIFLEQGHPSALDHERCPHTSEVQSKEDTNRTYDPMRDSL
ncbi:hypothetical protein Dimus_030232, partial [Dionaea muscipula]